MLTKWRLSNFKAVKQTVDFDLAPLTLLAGANSSGKSSIIQSILLLSQTAANQDPARAIVLNGTLARLGQMTDLSSFGNPIKHISIGWELKPQSSGFYGIGTNDPFFAQLSPYQHFGINWTHKGEIEFDSKDFDGAESDTGQLNPLIQSLMLTFMDDSEPENQVEYFIKLKRNKKLPHEQSKLEMEDLFATDYGSGLEYETLVDDISMSELRHDVPTGETVGCSLNHFLPSKLLLKFKRKIEILSAFEELLNEENKPLRSRFRVTLPKALRARLGKHFGIPDYRLYRFSSFIQGARALKISRKQLKTFFEQERVEIENDIDTETDEHLKSSELPSLIASGTKFVELFFRHNVRYLGPLRSAPKTVYPLTSVSDSRDLGLSGENTAAVYHQFKDRMCIVMPPEKLETDVESDPFSVYSLAEGTAMWLKYLGVADGVYSIDRGKEGHELNVQTPGSLEQHDLTHAGVGVSQVIPIIVMGILADKDTCLLFEQPELHLHPRVQTRLADFFLSLAMLGKQCIVETHSEYLVDRLRWRTAKAKGDSLMSTFRIYFVRKTGAESTFREVHVSKYGAIEDWPDGFFDQSHRETENILLAATEKYELEEKDED